MSLTVPHVYQATAVRIEGGQQKVIARRFFRCEHGDKNFVGRRALQSVVRGRFLMQIRPVEPHELGMKPLQETKGAAA